MKYKLLLLLIVSSCTSSSTEGDLSLKLKELKNTVPISNEGSTKTIQLLPETIIDNKNNEVVFGTLTQIEIDNSGRIYLGDFLQKKIHVYDKKGDNITSLGREGVGPGEFQGFSHMNITENKLSAFDGWQFRINEFNLETLSYSKSTTVRRYPRNVDEYEEIEGWIPMYVIPRFDSTTLTGFMAHPKDTRIEVETYNLGEYRAVKYYYMNYQGKIISDQLFEKRDHEDLMVTVDGRHLSKVQPVPFLGKTILRVSQNKEIISVWTKDFIIKVYDANGNYERALYHLNHNKRLLSREELLGLLDKDDSYDRSLFQHADLPEYWPSIFTIKLDDKNRIWAGVINEGEHILEWWVITQQGDLVAKVQMPEDLSLEWLMFEPLIAIKGDHFYVSKKDPETEQEIVVIYKLKVMD